MNPSHQPILEVRDLGHDYPGGRRALEGVSLAVPRGARLAVLGPNGAGKTTLLLHLNGGLRPSRGALFLEGAAVAHDRAGLARLRAKVGLGLQDPDDQLFAGEVLADVAFGPLNLGLAEDEALRRARSALERMGVAGLAGSAPHLLSLGQKKRVALAGLLAMEPEVLALDEPFAGLDAAGAAALLSALGVLGAAGKTIILATHDVDLAWAWADLAAVLGDGRLLAAGPARLVMADRPAMEAAGLRAPAVVLAAARLAELGLWRPERPLPASLEELMAQAGRRDAAGADAPTPDGGPGPVNP